MRLVWLKADGIIELTNEMEEKELNTVLAAGTLRNKNKAYK